MSSIATTWGSADAERALAFPCDARLPDADTDLFRAVSVRAPPEVVFRWLCQLRVAPYSYDWIDNGGRASPRDLTPGADDLAVGQTVMSIFTLVDFAQGSHLTLRMSKRSAIRLFGEIAVSYVVLPAEGGETRLVAKLRVRATNRGRIGRARTWLLGWGDLVMMRKQLLTLKELAER